MEPLTVDAIKPLVTDDAKAPAVTIYAPMHRSATPPNMTEDQIRLKNLFKQASDVLEQTGEGTKLAKQLHAKLDELHQDKSFWENQENGLLVCAGPGFIRLFRLPVDTEEHVAVDTFYHLAPVISLLEDNQEFYVLVLAQHEPAFYKAGMYDLTPTGIKLPKSVEDGLGIDENNQKSEQQRSDSGSDGNTAAYNGRGGARDPREADRGRFLRIIDDLIVQNTDHKLPLLIAGVESEVVEYKNSSKYPKILEPIMSGNFVAQSPQEIFTTASTLYGQAVIDAKHSEAIERYERVHGTNPQLTAAENVTVAEAAEEGRVDTLLIAMSRFTTDSVRDNVSPATVLTFPEGEADPLVHMAAKQTWSQGGQVINVDEDKLPLNVNMHAILRY